MFEQMKYVAGFVLLWAIFIIIKLSLPFEIFEESLGDVLFIGTLLFSFLIGFYLSSRYDRYKMLREYAIDRHSALLNMIALVDNMTNGHKIRQRFHRIVNEVAIMNELVEWEDSYLQEPYFDKIEELITAFEVKNDKDWVLCENFLNHIEEIKNKCHTINAVGRDTLSSIHWVMLIALSFNLIVTSLALPVHNILGVIIIMMFPPITILLIYMIHGYEKMLFFRASISIEINQKLFDAIGVKHFHPTWTLKYLRPEIRRDKKDYRTEHDLTGFEKEVYLDYTTKDVYFEKKKKKFYRETI